MKRLKHYAVFILMLFPALLKGQTGISENMNYGLGIHIIAPVFKPISNDSLGVKAGWGTNLFFESEVNRNWGWRIRAGFDQSRYINDLENTTTIFNNGSLLATTLFLPEEMSETHFEFGLAGNYSFMGAREVLDGSKQSGIRVERYRPPIRIDVGVTFGIAFELKPQLLLRFNYTEYILSQQYTNFIDGRPDQLQVGLDIRFNKLNEIVGSDDYLETYQELNALAGGKMIFMISTRLGEVKSVYDSTERAELAEEIHRSNRNLVRSIYQHYNFSDFLVCYDTAVNNLEEGKVQNIFLDSNMNYKSGILDGFRMYAYVGDNFYSEGRRWATGIYIYDSEFQLMKDPFPYFTKFREKSDDLFGIYNMQRMVMDMNQSLYDQQRTLQMRFEPRP